jgi:hypothetical protein
MRSPCYGPDQAWYQARPYLHPRLHPMQSRTLQIKDVGAWLGSTPRRYQYGQTDAFVTSATAVMRKHEPLHEAATTLQLVGRVLIAS